LGKLPVELISKVDTILKAHDMQREYQLPDGEILKIDKERFMCVEPLFNPTLIRQDPQDPLPKLVQQAIAQCDETLRQQLFQNLILGGGNTLFKGLSERLLKELSMLLGDQVQTVKPKVTVPETKHSAWVGGSILGSLSTFEKLWIGKEEYDECGALPSLSWGLVEKDGVDSDTLVGPLIVHRKCLM
jgi:actin-related protein